MRKGTQREILDEAIARVYPTRTWGVLDDEARFGAGLSRAEGKRLARSIAAVAEAPVIFRAGEPEDLCDFAWVLCVGRRPSLVEIRDGMVAAAEQDLVPGVRVEERWLRIALSSVARMAAMQEVALTLEVPEGDGDDEGGGEGSRVRRGNGHGDGHGHGHGHGHDDGHGPRMIREAPRPGVFDPILLKRVRKIVALLEASDVAHVDFGLLDRPLEGASPGDYEARYGCAPRVANFLFYAAPPSVHTVSAIGIVERAAGEARERRVAP